MVTLLTKVIDVLSLSQQLERVVIRSYYLGGWVEVGVGGWDEVKMVGKTL